jgi:hypothetical protein
MLNIIKYIPLSVFSITLFSSIALSLPFEYDFDNPEYRQIKVRFVYDKVKKKPSKIDFSKHFRHMVEIIRYTQPIYMMYENGKIVQHMNWNLIRHDNSMFRPYKDRKD